MPPRRNADASRAVALAGALLSLLLAFAALRPVSTPGPRLRDFEAYYAAGSARNAGDDPYSRKLWRAERVIPGVVPAREELLPFVGPPFGLLLWSALARLAYDDASIVWGCVLALAFAVLTLGALRLAGGADPLDYVAALALGASFGPLTSGLALGQVAVVACAAAIAAQFALGARSALWPALWACVAALQPNCAIALVARLAERRAAIALSLAAAVAAGGSLVAVGGFTGLGAYLTLLRQQTQAEAGIAIQVTVDAVARAFGLAARAADAVAVGVGLAVLLAIVALFVTRRFPALQRYALLAAALPLAMPFFHEHDLVLVLFAAIFCARGLHGRRWFAGAFGTLLVAVDWLGLAQRPDGAPQSLALASAAALAFAALGPASLGASRFVLLAVVPFVALAAWGAAAHPVPIWPDALPSHFSAERMLSNAQTWAAEQAVAGLARQDAVWGALRLATLGGCALVAFALAARPARAANAQ